MKNKLSSKSKACQNEERWCFPFSDIIFRSIDINDFVLYKLDN